MKDGEEKKERERDEKRYTKKLRISVIVMGYQLSGTKGSNLLYFANSEKLDLRDARSTFASSGKESTIAGSGTEK